MQQYLFNDGKLVGKIEGKTSYILDSTGHFKKSKHKTAVKKASSVNSAIYFLNTLSPIKNTPFV